MSSEINTRIINALQATAEVDSKYLMSTLKQRIQCGAGSVIVGHQSAESLLMGLKAANWEEYSHPAIADGCVGYRTHDLRGYYGITPIADDMTVVLDDRKNTGKISATVLGACGDHVKYVVIILGQDMGREIVFTVHPGDPVIPSAVQATPGMHGRTITGAEAKAMGLYTAKIVA